MKEKLILRFELTFDGIVTHTDDEAKALLEYFVKQMNEQLQPAEINAKIHDNTSIIQGKELLARAKCEYGQISVTTPTERSCLEHGVPYTPRKKTRPLCEIFPRMVQHE